MVGRLELCRGHVATGAVEAAAVPEVDPVRGRQLDLVDAPRGPSPLSLHGEIGWRTPAERYDGTAFTDRGFEFIPALEHLQGWLHELMATSDAPMSRYL